MDGRKKSNNFHSDNSRTVIDELVYSYFKLCVDKCWHKTTRQRHNKFGHFLSSYFLKPNGKFFLDTRNISLFPSQKQRRIQNPVKHPLRLTYLRAFVPYALLCLRASCAFVPYVPSRLTCLDLYVT